MNSMLTEEQKANLQILKNKRDDYGRVPTAFCVEQAVSNQDEIKAASELAEEGILEVVRAKNIAYRKTYFNYKLYRMTGS